MRENVGLQKMKESRTNDITFITRERYPVSHSTIIGTEITESPLTNKSLENITNSLEHSTAYLVRCPNRSISF